MNVIDIPQRGFQPSVKTHNVELDRLCDWLEGCILFSSDNISVSEIVDLLKDNHIYLNQDFAKERLEDGFKELERRALCLGNTVPYKIEKNRIRRILKWTDVPGFAFCLMLSLQTIYRKNFFSKFGNNYTEQGLLLEKLTECAVEKLGWKSKAVGWSKTSTTKLRDRVQDLATHLGEESRLDNVERWSNKDAKDGGLDVVCDMRFADGWSGRPLLFIQCASGEDWKNKKSSPELLLWDKMLDFATRPNRGIAIPFALLADDFRKHANCSQLLLILDRHRLCAPSLDVQKDWIDPILTTELNKWTEKRIKVLPFI